MNLEALKVIARQPKQFDWCGQQVWLRKLNARDHVELFKQIGKEAEVERDAAADREATVAFNLNIVARSLCDEQGNLIADSDEGREFLRSEPGFEDLAKLAELALAHSGYDITKAEKKS